MNPREYPARCDPDREGLQCLRERFRDADDPFGERYDEWPPADSHGDTYPLFFDAEDVNDNGKLVDSGANPYSPFAGNLTPLVEDEWERCNTPLNRWRERYPDVRYCGSIVPIGEDQSYCATHKNREHTMKSAEEHLQTGLHTKSLDHLYENLAPLKKLFGWGTYESLMGESTYEYAVEYETREFDFSDEDIKPDGVDDDGVLEVKCGYPTEHTDPALSLYVAAMQSVQMIMIQPKIMYENEEEGEGMMESRTVEKAQLTSPPTEHDPSPQEFKTIESWSEHHLNLPLSRLVTDRPKLLERGGVVVDPEGESDDVNADDIVLEIEADADGVETKDDTGTDPNHLGDDLTSESQRIVDKTSDD